MHPAKSFSSRCAYLSVKCIAGNTCMRIIDPTLKQKKPFLQEQDINDPDVLMPAHSYGPELDSFRLYPLLFSPCHMC